MIREVRETDFKQIFELAKEAYDTTCESFGWEEQDAIKTVKHYMKALFFLVEEQRGELTGFIAGNICKEPFNHNKKVLYEVGWYSKTNGYKLFNELVRRLKKEGVNKITFPSNNDRLARFYKRKGFKTLETQWIKEL